jgi:hypothetical protein
MNVALWILQGLLAATFLAAGGMKLVTAREKLQRQAHMGWVNDFTAGQIKLIGLAEVLGAAGLVVPWLLRIAPVLSPIAALCLALLMAGAVRVHVRRKEPFVPPLVLGLFAAVVAIGRSGLLGV